MSLRIIVTNKKDVLQANTIISTLNIIIKKFNITAYCEIYGNNVNVQSTINLYLNNIILTRDAFLYPSKYVFFMPNNLKFDMYGERFLKVVDIVLCRTKSEQYAFEKIKTMKSFSYYTYYTSWFADDCQSDISGYMTYPPTHKEKNNNLWYHIVPEGDKYMGTRELIQVWLKNNGFSKSIKLVIISSDIDLTYFFNNYVVKKKSSIFGISVKCITIKNIIIVPEKPPDILYEYVVKNGQVAIATNTCENNINIPLNNGLCAKACVISTNIKTNCEIVKSGTINIKCDLDGVIQKKNKNK